MNILGQEYQLYVSTAPKAYDSGSVIPIYDDGEGRRYFLLPDFDVAWQRGRNGSGLYTLEPSNGIPDTVILGKLWDRIREKQ